MSGMMSGAGGMSMMSGAVSLIGSGITAMGQLSAGDAAVLAARRRQQAAEFEATQLDQQASEQLASSQVQRQLVARQTKLANSALMARAAASGAGASDPTVVNLVARNAQEGAFREATALYEGETAARTSRLKAMEDRFAGQNEMADAQVTKAGSRLAAISTLTGGVAQYGTTMSKYWKPPQTVKQPTATGDW